MAITYVGGGTDTWYNWNSVTAATTSYTTNVTAVWNGWIVAGTGTGYSTTSTTWQYWNDAPHVTRYVETDEEREERLTREKERREQEEKRREETAKRRLTARETAKATFIEHLTEQQRVEFESTGKISVQGSDGHTYHVDTTMGIGANVTQVADGQPVLRLCAHPRVYDGESDPIPEYDHYLAQIITLTLNAEHFKQVANSHRLDFRPNVQVPA